jgi:hypothetical protein
MQWGRGVARAPDLAQLHELHALCVHVLCRCERKALNDMNHANDTQALRYPVMATNDDGSSTGKVKQRITSAQEKLFILVS